MQGMRQCFPQMESKIRYMIDRLQGGQENPPELRDTTDRLLLEALKLDECLYGDDLRGFKNLLNEMKSEAWKARTFAAVCPGIPEKTQQNLEYVLYSVEDLCRQTGLN